MNYILGTVSVLCAVICVCCAIISGKVVDIFETYEEPRIIGDDCPLIPEEMEDE